MVDDDEMYGLLEDDGTFLKPGCFQSAQTIVVFLIIVVAVAVIYVVR